MKKLRILAFVLLCLCALGLFGCAGAETVMYVNNPKATDRLNLREAPKTSAASLGKYYNGTQVTVQKILSDGWAQVEIYDGLRSGYMQTKYLSQALVASAMPVGETGQSDVLYSRMDTTGVGTTLPGYTTVLVMGFTENWVHVYVPGENATGFLHTTLEKLMDSKAQVKSLAWVSNPNAADRLNLRAKPSTSASTLGKYYNGTRVDIVGLASKGFVKVRIGEVAEGYMETKYLSAYQVESAQPEVCITLEGTQLRMKPRAKGKTIDTLHKDTVVTVLAVRGSWYHVQVENLDGYVPATATSEQLKR